MAGETPDLMKMTATLLVLSRATRETNPGEVRIGADFLDDAAVMLANLASERDAAVQAEREACADEAEDLDREESYTAGGPEQNACEVIAARIRARGPTDALTAALAKARAEGMEAAAVWHEEQAAINATAGSPTSSANHSRYAAAIRALIEQGDKP